MPVIVLPYIPSTITVHLGLPDQWAENVTVSFPDYVKNVASSEIYPTWELSAIRANVLAIISFALNRVYTEFYPSRGYNFQITNTTAYDQKFIRGRSFFQSISAVVDEIFNDYIRRQGFVEPLSAKFCNGTTSTCDGLSQWGSQEMAQTGYNSMEILRHYYGDDIELVVNAPIQDITQSYPGSPLRLGSVGEEVAVVVGRDGMVAVVGAVCHRPDRVCALLGAGAEHVLTPEDVALLLANPQGGRKGVGEAMAFRCVLNKADTPERAAHASAVAGRLAERGIHSAITYYREEERGGLCWF